MSEPSDQSGPSPLRVLLVDPPERLRYSSFLIPNMGLAYLAAVLRGKGHSVQVFLGQLHPQPLDAYRRRLAEFRPEVVGLSAPTLKIRQAESYAAAAKGFDPGIRTVLGGWHVSALPRRTLEEFAAFDFGVFGEGEDTFPDLLESRCGAAREPDDIAGLVWRQDGTVRENPAREFRRELSTLPWPAWDLFAIDHSVPMYRKPVAGRPDYPLMTARGCPFHCLFCKSVTGHQIRVRAETEVLEEYGRGLADYRCDGVQFYDESFTVRPERTRAICEGLIRSGLHERSFWNCASRVDGLSRELLSLMKRAGCRVIQLGMESGNQEILDRNRKAIRLEQGRNAVQWCREAGILSDVSFILGLPYETRKTLRDTVSFSFELNPDFISYFTLVPFPETEVYRLARQGEANLKLLDDRWENYSKQFFPLVRLKGVSASYIVLLRFYAYSRFYFRRGRFRNLLVMFDPKSVPRILGLTLRQMARSVWDRLTGAS